MHLADYIVSYSLQINNRCLHYLAECDVHTGVATAAETEGFTGEVHTVYAESLLARDSRRLASMWSLMQAGWKNGADELVRHVVSVGLAAHALADASSCRRLALRLASLAGEDHEAEAILKVARNLPVETPMTWDVLNELFTQDSHYWRNADGFKLLDDAVIQQRIARSYRKCYRQAAGMATHETGPWLDKNSDNFHQWVQRTAHQMELLRPGLSDNGKAQLWYLDKMSDTLRTRTGLRNLRQASRRVQVKKAASKLVMKHVEQQIRKMDKRIVRLAEGCFGTKPKRLNVLTQQAVSALGLGEISLMKNMPPARVGETTTTDNSYG